MLKGRPAENPPGAPPILQTTDRQLMRSQHCVSVMAVAFMLLEAVLLGGERGRA